MNGAVHKAFRLEKCCDRLCKNTQDGNGQRAVRIRLEMAERLDPVPQGNNTENAGDQEKNRVQNEVCSGVDRDADCFRNQTAHFPKEAE